MGQSKARVGALLLGLQAIGFSPLSAEETETIPFREAWGWAVIVPVAPGGSGPHEFLLDTGATFTVLEPALAAELGIAAGPSADRVTLTGEDAVSTGRVSLALGRTVLEGVEVMIADLPAIRSVEPRVRGLLGQSALARLEYTIDHARRRLIVHRSLASAAAPARPTLEARLGCGLPSARLVLDSGVGTPVLFERSGLLLNVTTLGPIAAHTNSGDAVWREGRLSSLCVAGRRTSRVPVVLRPASLPARAEDGLLPSRFFARVRVGPSGTVLAVAHW